MTINNLKVEHWNMFEYTFYVLLLITVNYTVLLQEQHRNLTHELY